MSNSPFVNGLVSGAVGSFSVYPIDVVKTRMQNQTESNRIYKNGFDCWDKLRKEGGIRAFYRGSLVQTTMVGPEKAIKLFVYTKITETHKDDARYHILGGLAAGTAQVMITSPYEMVKTNLQMANRLDYSQLLNPRKLYTGAAACFLRDIPFSGVYFPLYWWLKDRCKLHVFVAGTIAGAPAAFLCTPADVTKTRMQTFKNKNIDTKSGLIDIAKAIYKEEGLRAFFKGGGWRVMRSSPQFGITLVTFEWLQN